MGQPHGLAEGGTEFGVGIGALSGVDNRESEPHEYLNNIVVGLSGGPGLYGHDGWLTYEAPNGGGVMALSSIEIEEEKYPVLIEARRVAMDSMGAGQWNGAPAAEGSYRSLSGEFTFAYCSDVDVNPARGVLGGLDGAPALNQRRGANGELETLPPFAFDVCRADQALVFRTCAGGGYGNPLQREPARVVHDVNCLWLSPERAKKAYGVEVERAEDGITFQLAMSHRQDH